MLNGLEIGLYDKKDREQCIRLLESCFPETSNEKTFAWRFESMRNPEPLMICAKHEGKVIGFNAWLPWEFSYRGDIYLAYQSGESATHVDYRSYGIFKKVLEFADNYVNEKKIDFFFGFPSPPSYRAGLKAGFHSVATHYYHVRPLFPFYRRKEDKSYKITAIPESPILKQTDKMTPVINKDYCRWRYDENPKSYDKFEHVEVNSAMTAYLRQNIRKGFSEFVLLDSQFMSFDEMFVERAIKHLESKLPRNTFYLWTFFNDNSDRGRVLKRFFPIKMNSKYQTLFVKNISNRLDMEFILNSNSWDIMPHNVDWL